MNTNHSSVAGKHLSDGFAAALQHSITSRSSCPAQGCCWLGRMESPADLVLFLGFNMPGVIRGMEVRIGGADRLMAQIVPHVAKVDCVVRHM
jgi:hypothetical protein